MAYFFRKTAKKHAVLLKDKQIVFDQRNTNSAPSSTPAPRNGDPIDSTITDPEVKDEEQDQSLNFSMNHVTSVTNGPEDPFVIEDVKPDLKPRLKVRYSGFTIFNRTLVVVVEPWPALPAPAVEPVINRSTEIRQLSTSPTDHRSRSVSEMSQPPRLSETPLFRPVTPSVDGDEDEGLDRFRARSQSLARQLYDDEEVEV